MMTRPRMMDTSAPVPTVTDSSFCMEYCMECGPPFFRNERDPATPRWMGDTLGPVPANRE